jgi:hypothetical protein
MRQMLDEWNRLHPGNPWKPGPASATPAQTGAGGGDALYDTIPELDKCACFRWRVIRRLPMPGPECVTKSRSALRTSYTP